MDNKDGSKKCGGGIYLAFGAGDIPTVSVSDITEGSGAGKVGTAAYGTLLAAH